MLRRIHLFLLALALLSLSAPAWATVIYVSGDQTGTWSADTVIVTAEVRVPPGQSLTILPGVEVLFSVYCKLIVDSAATLRAVGTPADSIRFDVLSPNQFWHGIRFLSASDSVRLEYCLLTHGSAAGSIIADMSGGAIYCNFSSPIISSNTISGNSALVGGGIHCENGSSPVINDNSICGNFGGGICCWNSNPTISGNAINGNAASGNYWLNSGGIACSNSNPTISNNIISGNSADLSQSGSGGGIFCGYYSNAVIHDNIISKNTTIYGSGGIYCLESNPIISGNTIVDNSARFLCGGIYCANSIPTLINCILWGNIPEQIVLYSSTIEVTYSDIQGGYAGTGNIATWPAFVDTAQSDYRLQWGSPCIDTGDPNPTYNDPDLTRADMGAWYYDQSMPVRILLTPYSAPIQVPAVGGNFQYAIQATNIESDSLSALIWCNITLPSGATYGPVLGPVTISLGAGQTVSRVRTQTVPAGAPAGMYHYNAYAVAMGDTSQDSFVFTKAVGFGESDLLGGWTNTGDDFGDVGASAAADCAPASGSEATPTMAISPNPFNPTTAISYQLSADSYVSLRIYDTAGRLVATLVDGWREAGDHQITFDGSNLPSGIYFAKLEAGDFSQVQKLILLK